MKDVKIPTALEEIKTLIDMYEINEGVVKEGRSETDKNKAEFTFFIDGFQVVLSANVRYVGREGVEWLAKTYAK